MGNKARTLDQQISILQARGMEIYDIEKAKEVLLDVGYYRLGFYWFPFEKNCPPNQRRNHEFKSGANFDDAVKLYYFDYELRNILLKYITRIEVNFRTYLIYTISNKYNDTPTWFMSSRIVDRDYITSFDKEVYTDKFKRNKFIATHHRIHINDRYAPAWKTLEFMTLGSNIALYKSLLNLDDKKIIAKHFGVTYTNIFENYLDVVRCVRNTCAHGGLLYDIALFPLIRKGPANIIGNERKQLYGALKVIGFLLRQVSINRAKDYEQEVKDLINKCATTPAIKSVLHQNSGFPI
ncbi:MAG: Abi family protein [Bacteroidales bacterium]|nr:Abi family protein [Bacteroidales bacterium]